MKLAKHLVFAMILASGVTALAQGTVRIAQTLSHNTLNPGGTTGLADATVERVIYEGLVGFDQTLQLVPELATSWEVNEDATTFTFDLREGVSFHDGSTFDANAVKAYFDWALDPENPITSRAQGVFADIEAVEVLEPLKVRFVLSKPNGAMLANLATFNGRIMSPTAIEEFGEDVGRHPVGTGPFRFVEWLDGQRITVEAYDGYWGEAAKVERIEFLEVSNAATRVAQLQGGEVQFIEALPSQLVSTIDDDPKLETTVTQTVFARIFPMNTQVEPFNDLRVRQALNYAIDKEQLIKVALQGFGTALTSVMPASVRGYAPQPPYEFDPEKARQLLSEAGYPEGFTFSVLTFNSTEFRTVGQVLQQMLAEVGVTMELNPTERGALVDAIFKPIEETQLEASLVGASTPTGDADRALRQSFATSSWPPAFNNWSFYSNAEVDELIQAGVSTGDQAERDRLYAKAQEIIWQDAPWIFLYSPDAIAGKSKNLSGVFYMPARTVDARKAALE